MDANVIRKTYLAFFKERGHAIIPSASLIPENDPTVLFTTAGMHPLVPFLLGEPHPEGKLLADAQKCIRTGDIEEVGDNRHLTFFEMLGNWSLGAYFKEKTIEWSYELLTAENGFGLNPNRLFVTVFKGDDDAPPDDVSISLWQEQFKKADIDAKVEERIFLYPKSENWWGPAGKTGPCGPDTEIFYDTLFDKPDYSANPKWHASPNWIDASGCHPNCDCGRYVEIWNDVFMEYNKTENGAFEPLAQRNVDTGMGLERMAMMLQNTETVFETDLFLPIIKKIEELSGKSYFNDLPQSNLPNNYTVAAMRIIADHIKAATFIVGDPRGVGPSNTEHGYIVRRLIRRAIIRGQQLGINDAFVSFVADVVIKMYSESYPELRKNRNKILNEFVNEEKKFSTTLVRGIRELDKLFGISNRKTEMDKERQKDVDEYGNLSQYFSNSALKSGVSWKEAAKGAVDSTGKIPGDKAFYLYESYGFPKELTEEMTGLKVDETAWDEAMKRHQELSRKGAEKKFAGGLADDSEEVVCLHTATHLLHQALRTVLGDHVEQRGSNITKDRLRFDFSHGEKMTPEQKEEVESLVNAQIAKDLPVHFETMSVEEAKSHGVIGLFEDKYAALGNKVKVYFVGDEALGFFSKEICGGPHVEHTGMLGSFKIKKEEASSAGVRRIKATVTGNG